MDVAAGGIVQLRIADDEAEIVLELESILVFSRLELSVHGAEIHGVLDDLEVADHISDKKYSGRLEWAYLGA